MKTIPAIVLPPIGILYGAVTRTRLALYKNGTLATTTLDRPVISVGNITAGGTGKTPLVDWIARVLADNGKKVCILTRGYRRENPKQRVLASDGETVFATPREAGDEAFLLATKLKGVAAVICDSNRTAAAQGAIKHLRTDCFILDDGFQHLQLSRNLNIVTIDATDPWGGGRLLPFGRLREPVGGLKRADCIVITRTDQVQSTESLQTELGRLSGDRPFFLSRSKTVQVRTLAGRIDVVSKKCAAFCAIGNPQSFFNHLQREGYDLVLEKSFRDHHFFSQDDIDSLTTEAKRLGADYIIATEKDAVKLTTIRFDLPFGVLETVLLVDNSNALKRLVVDAANATIK